MSIKDTINEKLKESMRMHDEDGKRVYRMILSSVKFAEKTAGKELSCAPWQDMIQSSR